MAKQEAVDLGDTPLSPEDFRTQLEELVADAHDQGLSTEEVIEQLTDLVQAIRLSLA
jgi:hypothetical protein